LQNTWTPVFTTVTTFYDGVNIERPTSNGIETRSGDEWLV
jgi:hypothetical protein